MPRPQPPPTEKLKGVLESLLFVAQGPVDVGVLARVLRVETGQVDEAVERLAAECRDRGVRIQRDGLYVQMVTDPEASAYVERLLGMDHQQRLSHAALEALAIIAYRQPIIRTEVETVRGVNVEGVLKTLLEKRLIRVMGRRNVVGRPLIYGTTNEFLQLFGLKALSELPRIEDFKEEIPVLRKEVPVSGTEETSSGDR